MQSVDSGNSCKRHTKGKLGELSLQTGTTKKPNEEVEIGHFKEKEGTEIINGLVCIRLQDFQSLMNTKCRTRIECLDLCQAGLR